MKHTFIYLIFLSSLSSFFIANTLPPTSENQQQAVINVHTQAALGQRAVTSMRADTTPSTQEAIPTPAPLATSDKPHELSVIQHTPTAAPLETVSSLEHPLASATESNLTMPLPSAAPTPIQDTLNNTEQLSSSTAQNQYVNEASAENATLPLRSSEELFVEENPLSDRDEEIINFEGQLDFEEEMPE